MSRIRIVLLMGLLAALTSFANAGEPALKTQAEIAELLNELGASHCDFFRNGSWYDSVKAESHLQRKLDYFERKNLLTTADAFITDAATQSSMSGEIYQVRCPGRTAQPSAEWLRAKLAELRQHTPYPQP